MNIGSVTYAPFKIKWAIYEHGPSWPESSIAELTFSYKIEKDELFFNFFVLNFWLICEQKHIENSRCFAQKPTPYSSIAELPFSYNV